MGNGPVTLALPDCIKHLEPDGFIHSTLDDCHPVVLVDSTTELHIAEFCSPMYPEDNKILGVFSSEEKADEWINSTVSSCARARPRAFDASKSNYYKHVAQLDMGMC